MITVEVQDNEALSGNDDNMIRNRWNSTLRIVLRIGDSIIGEKNGKADLKEILNDRPIEFFFFAGMHGYCVKFQVILFS